MSNKINVGLIQTYCGKSLEENVLRHFNLIRKAAEQGAQIICLQELFTTTYFCADYDDGAFEWAESIPGNLTERLSELAKELEVVILAPFFEKRAKGIYHNSMVVIDADGSLLGTYRKMHIPDDPGFYEKYYFTPGDDESSYKVFNTAYGKVGTLICWDQWYPEAARITALLGADILIYPTAIGVLKHESKADKTKFQDAWETVQRSHAIANGCFVASINRVGKEENTAFWGGSFVSGPFGEIKAKAGEKEEVIVVECDLSEIDTQRKEWPFLRDRRIDTYSPILKRHLERE